MTLQPAVVVTRTALISPFGDDGFINPYIYKVFLSE
jgi:hypothetical protein